MAGNTKTLGGVRALIFDLDGTLIDSKLDLALAVNAVFRINIVVGAGNNRVYSYNSSRVIAEMSMKDFMKEPK